MCSSDLPTHPPQARPLKRRPATTAATPTTTPGNALADAMAPLLSPSGGLKPTTPGAPATFVRLMEGAAGMAARNVLLGALALSPPPARAAVAAAGGLRALLGWLGGALAGVGVAEAARPEKAANAAPVVPAGKPRGRSRPRTRCPSWLHILFEKSYWLASEIDHRSNHVRVVCLA